MSSFVKIFDTTLRDGEQCPGAAMSEDEKVEIAQHLAKMRVDVIEAGFPISSPIQFQAVERIAKVVEGPTIAALARAIPADIESAAKAIAPAAFKRIHTFIASSPIHMKHKLGKTPKEVLEMARLAVLLSRDLVSDVEFSCEDATRSEKDFLVELLETVIIAGATTLNIPDTVGYTTPKEYGELFAYLRHHVRGIEKVVLSTHCHNDLGLAVANSLAGVENGARQIECTINGIGERAGNTAMEEVVMALLTRKDHYSIVTNVDSTQITRGSYLVKTITGMVVQPNKAIVGANAFAHESGIHQDGVLKNRETYEIMKPESVGLSSNKMVLGRHSGRAGFKDRIKRLGLDTKSVDLEQLYEKFLILADRKKEIYDEDILALFSMNDEITTNHFELVKFSVSTGSNQTPKASVELKTSSGMQVSSVEGDGPVDSIFKSICAIVGFSPNLLRLLISPVTEGSDAMAEANVTLEWDGKRVVGKSSSTDILEAFALSYVNALNRLQSKDVP